MIYIPLVSNTVVRVPLKGSIRITTRGIIGV